MVHAAIGLRVHSGWAVLVAVAGSPASPDVIDRRRIELIDGESLGGPQPYHAAAEMESGPGKELVGRAIASARVHAAKALRAAVADLRKKGYNAGACGIVAASGKPLPELRAILASHALIHTAEGEMFRDALAHAAHQMGLAVERVPEKGLFAAVKPRLGISEEALKRRLAEIGRQIGSPWRQDEKNATVVAALVLGAAQC